MDLRSYYKRLREVENGLPDPFVVLYSLNTPDGGKAGVLMETTRYTAAKQIMEGRARAATAEESEAFHHQNREAKLASDQAAAVNRMQFVMVPAKHPVKGVKE